MKRFWKRKRAAEEKTGHDWGDSAEHEPVGDSEDVAAALGGSRFASAVARVLPDGARAHELTEADIDTMAGALRDATPSEMLSSGLDGPSTAGVLSAPPRRRSMMTTSSVGLLDLSQVENFEDLTRADLVQALRERGLSTEGRIMALVQRLQQWIADEQTREQREQQEREEREWATMEDRGSVYAFGRNHLGQLGVGDDEDRELPALIGPLVGKNVMQVCVGFDADASFAVTEIGDVYGWGGGLSPLNGTHGVYADLKMEVPIDGHLRPLYITAFKEDGVRQLSVSSTHVLACTHSGHGYVWGQNTYGQLGFGDDVVDEDVPSRMDAYSTGFVGVSAGHNFSAAVTDSELLYTWGSTVDHRLGLGTLEREGVERYQRGYFPSPVPVTKPRIAFSRVCCSVSHSLALASDGSLYAWGCGDGFRLGCGDCEDRPIPTELRALRGLQVLHISVGQWHNAVIVRDGRSKLDSRVYTWGTGYFGQLAHRTESVLKVPTVATAVEDTRCRYVSCGMYHNAAITQSGRVITWGRARYGCLGRPKSLQSLRRQYTVDAMPVERLGIKGRGRARTVACGRDYTLVVTLPGSLESVSKEETVSDDWLSAEGKVEVGREQAVRAAAAAREAREKEKEEKEKEEKEREEREGEEEKGEDAEEAKREAKKEAAEEGDAEEVEEEPSVAEFGSDDDDGDDMAEEVEIDEAMAAIDGDDDDGDDDVIEEVEHELHDEDDDGEERKEAGV